MLSEASFRSRSTWGRSTALLLLSDCAAGMWSSRRTAQLCIYSSSAGDLSDLVDLDEVALLDVVEVGQADTALEALGHLANVVLEPLERVDGPVVGDDSGAQQPGTGTALDHAFGDVATGDGSDPGNPEHGPDLGGAEHDFLLLGGELANQGLFDLVQQLVDDAVGADLDPQALGCLAGTRLRTHVEADDDGVGDVGEVDVVLVDAPHRPVDDLDLAAFAGDLADRLPERLERPLRVGFDDDPQGGVLGAELFEQALEPLPGGRDLLLLLADRLHPLLGDGPGFLLVLDDLEEVTGGGHVLPAHDLHGRGGTCLLDPAPGVVGHRPHTTGHRAGDEGVALLESAPLHDHRCDRAPAPFQLSFHHHARGRRLGVGPVVLELGNQVDDLEQILDAFAGEGADFDAGDVAAQFFGDDLVLGELGADPHGVGAGRVHLVDGHDHADTGGL